MVEQHAEFLCDYITSCCDKSDSNKDDIILVLLDGQVKINKLLLAAVSEFRDALEDCDTIIVESSLHIGQLLPELLFKGRTSDISQNTAEELERLLKLLTISIDFVVENNVPSTVPELSELTNIALPEGDTEIFTEEKERIMSKL